MELTKYEHSCFTVKKDDQVLVVDPGDWTTDFIAPDGVVGIVITHEHGDHFSHDQIAAIVDKNPDAVIIAHSSITKTIEVFQTTAVTAGQKITIGPFSLAFFGGEHAAIYSESPPLSNLGIMINDLIYYPGDSFALPSQAVDTLLLPVSAPWLKISEVIDFLNTIHPRFALPTHDAILSASGKELADRLVGSYAKNAGTEYRRIDNETIVI